MRVMFFGDVLAPESLFSAMPLRNSLRLLGSLKQSSQTRIAENNDLLEQVFKEHDPQYQSESNINVGEVSQST